MKGAATPGALACCVGSAACRARARGGNRFFLVGGLLLVALAFWVSGRPTPLSTGKVLMVAANTAKAAASAQSDDVRSRVEPRGEGEVLLREGANH